MAAIRGHHPQVIPAVTASGLASTAWGGDTHVMRQARSRGSAGRFRISACSRWRTMAVRSRPANAKARVRPGDVVGNRMPPVKVDPAKIRTFESAARFYAWLGKHHDKATDIWSKIHKLGSSLKSITPAEAIDVVLCWGWIDGLRKGFDDKSFLQRYTPRRARSGWSQINVDNVARLIAEGRMTAHGLKTVEAAKADGR